MRFALVAALLVALGGCGPASAPVSAPATRTPVSAPASGILLRVDAATRALAAIDAEHPLARQALEALPARDGCTRATDRVRRFELAASRGGMFVHALGDVTVDDVACWLGAGAPVGGRLDLDGMTVAPIDGGVEVVVGTPEARAGTNPLAARFVALRKHHVAVAASVGPDDARVEIELTGDGPVLDGWVFTFKDEATARVVETELSSIFERAAALDPGFGDARPTRRGRAIDFAGVGAAFEVLSGRMTLDVVEAFRVPAASMLPTLYIGDLIYVVKPAVSRPVERGDVVVVPVGGRHFVKRVVGVGGDTVTVDAEGLSVNGVRATRSVRARRQRLPDLDDVSGTWSEIEATILDETLDGRTHAIAEATSAGPTGTWSVPAGQLFLVGDFRDNSNDSRSWGAIPAEELIGIARIRWFSIGRDWVDWDRAFTAIE